MSEETSSQFPPVPNFDVSKVLKKRNQIADFLLTNYRGTRPTGDEFESLVRGVKRLLPDTVREPALLQSLSHIAGQQITNEIGLTLAWRLAANTPLLKSGRSIIADTWQMEAHWALLQIMSVRPLLVFPDDKEKRQMGAHLNFSIIVGLSASMSFRKFWSKDLIRYFNNEAGFSAPWGKSPFSDDRELVNFRLCAYIDPSKCRDGQPNFRHMKLTASNQQWNRDLIAMRRRDKFVCPRHYLPTQPCYSCPAGQGECEAACHPRSYIMRLCPRCGTSAFFDPDSNNHHPEMCVNCGRRIDLGQIKRTT